MLGFFNEGKAQSGVDYQARKKSPESSICWGNFFREETEKTVLHFLLLQAEFKMIKLANL